MERDEFSRRVRAMTDRLYRITYGQLRDPQDRMERRAERAAEGVVSPAQAARAGLF